MFAIGANPAHAQPLDREITVNGQRIHYLDWGSKGKQPMLLLHGIERVARTFDHVAPHYRDNYHVIAVDLRGHGDSGWDPRGAYLVEDYVRDIAGLVTQLGLSDVVLWGNSTGGRVAQVFAGLNPELVSAVIVEDVGPERPPSISDRVAQRVAREEQGWASTENLFAQVKAAYPRTDETQLRNFLQYASKQRADGRIVWKRDPAITKGFVPTELWASVSKIKCPVIYVLGGASTIVPAQTQERLRGTLPQVQIVTLPGLGHYPSEEDPAAFLSIADRFLEQAALRK